MFEPSKNGTASTAYFKVAKGLVMVGDDSSPLFAIISVSGKLFSFRISVNSDEILSKFALDLSMIGVISLRLDAVELSKEKLSCLTKGWVVPAGVEAKRGMEECKIPLGFPWLSNAVL